MKITKFPQSCLLIEKGTTRILIDPGNLVAPQFGADDFGRIDAILITHAHADHADAGLIADLAGENVPVFGNVHTATVLDGLVTNTVQDRDELALGECTVVARELPHMPLIDGSAGPQNTGYVIDGAFFHPGDGLEIDGLHVPAAAVPVAGPSASPRTVVGFIRSVGCTTVVPVHFTNSLFSRDGELVERWLQAVGDEVSVRYLADGESTEIL